MTAIPKLGIPNARVKLEYDREGDVPLMIFSDVHIGSPFCDTQLLERCLRHADEIGAYFWLNGDLTENATKRSVGDVHEQIMNPTEQMEEVRRLWGGHRRPKVIATVSGNHEGRTNRDSDFDVVRYWATEQPMVPYLNRAGVVALTVKGHKWTIYGMHGVRGCGRKAGGSVNAIQDMAEVVDADLYIHGHHHQANFTHKMQLQHKDPIGFYWRKRWFVNAGTFHRYGGYGSDAAYPATDVGAYLVWFSDNTKGKSGKNIRVEMLDRAYFGMPRL